MKRILTICGVAAGILFLLAAALLFACLGITAHTDLDLSLLTPEGNFIRLYDMDGALLPAAGKSSAEHIPQYVKDAFVAVEDKRFYSHGGVDARRMCAALLKNLTSFSFAEGASTITQQLIKNTHLSSEKTIARKLKEIKLARQLEKRRSKEEILALYLDSIYFGHSAFGIGSAARFYFGKSCEDLTVAEGAMLAAVVRSPNRYSPFRDSDACLARRSLVLRLMREQGMLDEARYQKALREPLPLSPAPVETGNAYTARVISELCDLFPDARSGDWGTLRVYTGLDRKLQEALERTQCETDVCLLIRDNRDSVLRALYATAGTPARQPASLIKPLCVYAPALEENFISPATPLSDERADFHGYRPDDYGGATGTYMSARYALANSVNIPAVRVLNEMGVETGVRYLEKMHLPVEEGDRSLALALGGMVHGCSLPALADGYAVFAAGGVYAPASCIVRVENERGDVLYSHDGTRRERVFSEDVCFLINDMLMTCVREGTAKKLRTLPYPVCAKTGTAGTDAGNTDAYCIAYTRDHVVAAWMGNADNMPVRTTGGGLPANAALAMLQTLYRGTQPSPFAAAEGVVSLDLDRAAYENDHALLLADPASPPATTVRELFRACAAPDKVCTRFSSPRIPAPAIAVRGSAVVISLPHERYYEYEIIRENRGRTATIYSGPYRDTVCDNCVAAGETYVYTVVPRFRSRKGEPVVLPSVTLPAAATPPGDWWLSQ